MSQTLKKLPANGSDDSQWLERVLRNVKSLRYGAVEIVVHDAQVIQIDTTERVRLDKAGIRLEQT